MGKATRIRFVGYGITYDSGEAAIFNIFPNAPGNSYDYACLICVHCEWGSSGYTLHFRELGCDSQIINVRSKKAEICAAFDAVYNPLIANATENLTAIQRGRFVSKALRAALEKAMACGVI